MNVFDIIGPIMIGPPSSHTAGAVRLGYNAHKVLGEKAVKAEIELCGSFAQTYRGHGTDRALLAGIMGYHSYSPEIRDALEIAKEKGIDYTFLKRNIKGAHPNTALIHYWTEDGAEGTVQGASVGGGNILVNRINGMDVHFTGDNNTIIVMHHDKPGVIAAVTNMMHWQYADLNISSFYLSRESRGGNSIMTIEVDSLPPEDLMAKIREIDQVTNAILVRRL